MKIAGAKATQLSLMEYLLQKEFRRASMQNTFNGLSYTHVLSSTATKLNVHYKPTYENREGTRSTTDQARPAYWKSLMPVSTSNEACLEKNSSFCT